MCLFTCLCKWNYTSATYASGIKDQKRFLPENTMGFAEMKKMTKMAFL